MSSPAKLPRALDPIYIGSTWVQPLHLFEADKTTLLALDGRTVTIFLNRIGLPKKAVEVGGVENAPGVVVFRSEDTADWPRGPYAVEIRMTDGDDDLALAVSEVTVAKGAARQGDDRVGAARSPTAPGVAVGGAAPIAIALSPTGLKGDPPTTEEIDAVVAPRVEILSADLTSEVDAAKNGLSLVQDSFVVGSALGTVIGAVVGKRPNTSLTLSPNDGCLVVRGSEAGGWDIAVGGTVSAVGVIRTLLVETDHDDPSKSRSIPIDVWVNNPLPALPLAIGTKVMAVGHSQIQRSWFALPSGGQARGGTDSLVRGVLPWVRFLDPRFRIEVFPSSGNPFVADISSNALDGAAQAIGGDRLTMFANSNPGVLARLAYAIGRAPGIIYINIGSNDINSNGWTSAAPIIAQLDLALRQVRQAGIWCVLQTDFPRGQAAWPDGDIRHTMLEDLNAWIVAQAGREGVMVCDTRALFGSPVDLTLLSNDQIHLNPKGARAVAGVLLPILQSMVTVGVGFNTDPTGGNILPNYQLAGVAGGLGAGVTGQVADTFSVSRQTGTSTIVASKEAGSAGDRFKQRLTITPNPDGTAVHNFRFRKTAALMLAALGLVEGDWIEVACRVEMSAWDAWAGLQQYNEFYAGASLVWNGNTGLVNPDSASFLMPAGPHDGWFRTLVRVEPGKSIDRLRWESRAFELTFRSDLGGQGVLKISDPIIRKVADPRAGWSL
jgi:lysophospholipase L1-like esterase